ncbi:hypothetical protein L6452_01133 [Arctium lappa]|uniref:Uncharacterized protein n=1 Tax=Arctium lappa TaxID=4217 RepID=A0ACB9FFY1_ARCLA|nr:hypothetical protein L6452_01133 [Arctium lappa]
MWGLGYKNPHHLKKVISEVPALYDFGVFDKGETSTKVDKSVSVKSKKAKGKKQKSHFSQKPIPTGKPRKKHSLNSHHSNSKVSNVSDLRKQRVGVKTAWIPKQKIDEIAKSSSSFILNKKTSSKDDVIVNVATFKSNLVDSRKKYSIKQLFHGCSKHMTGQKSMLSNFTDKYCGTVRFVNDQFSPIMGYGDVVHDNITIKKVSYIEGLGHNLFSIGKFCDKDLEVNFKAKTCSVRTDEGKELLVGTRKLNLYTRAVHGRYGPLDPARPAR